MKERSTMTQEQKANEQDAFNRNPEQKGDGTAGPPGTNEPKQSPDQPDNQTGTNTTPNQPHESGNSKSLPTSVEHGNKNPSDSGGESPTNSQGEGSTDAGTSGTETPSSDNLPSGGGNDKIKDFAKGAGISALVIAKNKVAKKDNAAGKLVRAADKAYQAVKMKNAKYVGWIKSFVSFCVSNPVGWVVGIITIIILLAIGVDIGTSIYSAATSNPEIEQLTNQIKESANGSEDSSEDVSDGEKATVLLIDCKPTKNETATGGTSSAAASDADWTKEGTTAHKNAKDVWTAWTNAGVSGTSASGLVGWVNSEGGFDIIGRAEGHYGGGKENSIAHGAVPIPGGTGYSVGGGGIYQFTPYTKYAPLNDPKWEDGTVMTQFVINQLPGDWNPAHDLSGKNQTFEQWAQQENIADAALGWNAYERGDTAYIRNDQKIADAKRADAVFNKAKVKFDRAKYEKNFGSSKSSKVTSSDSSVKAKCKDNSSGGGNGWSKPGGKHNYQNGQAWKPQDLPSDLKQYALNPESMGMKYASSTGWNALPSSIDDQCTDLSASCMYLLWSKDGKNPKQLRGNGNAVAGNWAATYGGSVSTTPVSGAVFSTPGPVAEGHTGVVSHVFDDGSFLIIEQNRRGFSGQGNGTTFTWNYRIVSKDSIASNGYTFYNPGDNGFTPNPDAKSL